MAGPLLTDTLSVAARAVCSDGRNDVGLRTVMTVLGVEALVCYRVDDSEHARRLRAGAAADLTSPAALDLLLSLPVGVAVPLASLTARERYGLGEAVAAGAARVTNGKVTQHAIAPVAVDLAVVAAGGWRRGLEVAGRFTPFCARAMVLRRTPTDLQEMRLQ